MDEQKENLILHRQSSELPINNGAEFGFELAHGIKDYVERKLAPLKLPSHNSKQRMRGWKLRSRPIGPFDTWASTETVRNTARAVWFQGMARSFMRTVQQGRLQATAIRIGPSL